jgi:pseudolysin
MRKISVCALNLVSLMCLSSAWAAKPIDLNNQPVSILSSSETHLQEISRGNDFNQTTHIRLKQMYAGYPVWGGDVIVHLPRGGNAALNNFATNKNASMNGLLYQNLNQDLNNTPAYMSNAAQTDKALQQAIDLYQHKTGLKQSVTQTKSQRMVYVDGDNKAHWVFLISFLTHSVKNMPAKPTYIMDAVTFQVYKQWDDIQTLDDAQGGGFGGNENMGKLVYDGLKGSYPALTIDRDAASSICYLRNSDVTVKDVRKDDAVSQFSCAEPNKDHNNVYWGADLGAINGAYSPDNDALFAGKVIKNMYQDWYNIPVLTQDGKPMMLVMRVHENMENAYWDGQQMTFGDGGSMFYPLVSLGVGAHEVSHGFTQQHSALVYEGQSGGLNEAFSDMAAQAAEYYASKHNSWEIGPEIMKEKGKALRYMDEPTKDCEGGTPGNNCSISNVKDYNDSLDVHYSSGVFNKVFYLIGTSKKWNAKKAFNVMVQANQYYWTADTTFMDAACGVLKATKDYKYNTSAVQAAFKKVGINTKRC